MPNRPESIQWLTTQERDQLVYRLEVDRSSKDSTNEVSAGKAFMMAVTDIKTWLLCATLQCNYIAASVTNFFPIVVRGLGFVSTSAPWFSQAFRGTSVSFPNRFAQSIDRIKLI
jgi:hypothetical protein